MNEYAYQLLVRFIADWLVFIIVLIAAVVFFKRVTIAKVIPQLPRLFMFGLSAFAIAKIMSLLYQPQFERPFIEAGTQAGAAYLNNPGFPSDHSLFVAVVTLACWLMTRSKVALTILVSLSILVGIGRVLALVHTPLDVVGGFSAALLAAFIWYGEAVFSPSGLPKTN